MLKSKAWLYLLFPLIVFSYIIFGCSGRDEERPVINEKAASLTDEPLCTDRPYIIPKFYRNKPFRIDRSAFYTFGNGSWAIPVLVVSQNKFTNYVHSKSMSLDVVFARDHYIVVRTDLIDEKDSALVRATFSGKIGDTNNPMQKFVDVLGYKDVSGEMANFERAKVLNKGGRKP